MPSDKEHPLGLNSNAFGKLVKSFREQRGWSQGELAERWGHSREYVSMVERGKRKVDKHEQVVRLADVLGIPLEKLEEVGKMIPPRRKQATLKGDDILLQALLEPAGHTVQLSWLIWRGNEAYVDVEKSLQSLIHGLEQALSVYNGQFRKPAQRIQAHAYEMMGKLAIERVETQKAISYFQEMYDIAEELDDPDLVVLALINQFEMLRRNNRYEAMFRRSETAKKYIQRRKDQVSDHIKGLYWKTSAINYFTYGDMQGFLHAIGQAEVIADNIEVTIDTVSNEFDKVEVQQVKAQGFTQLWQPEKALKIYENIDNLRLHRPLRDLTSYEIIKAQAHCYVGDVQRGISYAVEGIELARQLHSIRYVTRLLQMSDRLYDTSLGKEPAMKELRREILTTLQIMKQ